MLGVQGSPSDFHVFEYGVGSRRNSRCGGRGGIGLSLPTTYKQFPEVGTTGEQQEQRDGDIAGYYEG